MQIATAPRLQFGCTAQIMMLKAKQKLNQFLKDRNIPVEEISLDSGAKRIAIRLTDEASIAQAKEVLKTLKELKLNKDGNSFTYGLFDVTLSKA